MAVVGDGDRLADHRRDRVRPLRQDLLLDGVGAGDVARLALDAEIIAIAVRRGDEADPVHEGTEELLVARRRDAHRPHGGAVIAAAPGDDLVALGKAAHRLDLLGDLHGALDRLGAARAEEEAIEVARRQPGQHLAELHRGCVRVARRGHIGELACLLRHRLADLLAAVADVHDIKTGNSIEEGTSVGVVERRALAANDDMQPIALGKVEPARRMDPDTIERLPLNPCELASFQFVCHAILLRAVAVRPGSADSRPSHDIDSRVLVRHTMWYTTRVSMSARPKFLQARRRMQPRPAPMGWTAF